MLIVPYVSDVLLAVILNDGQAHSHPVNSEPSVTVLPVPADEGILLQEERATPCSGRRVLRVPPAIFPYSSRI